MNTGRVYAAAWTAAGATILQLNRGVRPLFYCALQTAGHPYVSKTAQ